MRPTLSAALKVPQRPFRAGGIRQFREVHYVVIRHSRLWLALACVIATGEAHGQVRGVYPAGMNVTNGGVAPAPGFAYSNLFIVNSRDERVGAEGETLATGQQSILLDLNTVAWGSDGNVVGKARFGATATVILSKNSLTSDLEGSLGGGSGLGDLFIQPVILGWTNAQVDFRAAYGIVAPTGHFEAGADDNVGSGYWTHALSAGVTRYLAETRSNALSAFVMYELHEKQETTDVRPGDTLTLDASWMRVISSHADRLFQYGAAGYAQWQTTDKRGPGVSPGESNEHYRVYSLGLAAGLAWPTRRSSLMLKLLREFGARSTFEGYSIQLSAAVSFGAP